METKTIKVRTRTIISNMLYFLLGKNIHSKRATWLIIFAAILAPIVTFNPYQMFMGVNITFGMSVSLAVLFLARGWWGVVISIPIAMATYKLWGHPYSGYIFILEAIIISLLINSKKGDTYLKKGTILIWDFVFWLLIGSPLYYLAHRYLLGLEPDEAFLIAQKALVSGTLNVLIAYAIYAIFTLYRNKRLSASTNISIQALIIVTIYSVIVLSTVFTIRGLYSGLLHQKADTINNTFVYRSGVLFDGFIQPNKPLNKAAQSMLDYQKEFTFFWTKIGDNEELFASGPLEQYNGKLPENYVDVTETNRFGSTINNHYSDSEDKVQLYLPDKTSQTFSVWVSRAKDSYLKATFYEDDEKIIIIRPAGKYFKQIGNFYNLSLLTLNISFLIGIVFSTFIAWLVGKEFRFVLHGPSEKVRGQKLPEDQKRLQLSPIFEIKNFADEVNERTEVICKDKLKIEELNIIAQKQLNMAGTIQKCFLGDRCTSKQPDISLFMRPALNAGGDWYDAFDLDNKTFIVVADVCDKGVQAALFMSVFRSLIRYSAEHLCADPSDSEPLDEVITSVNKYMGTEHSDTLYFATVFIACICNKSKRLDYVLAGHEEPIFLDSEGNQHSLEVSGPAIGLFPDASYTMSSLPFTEGSILVGYTDGVIDCRNSDGESYGHERLVNLIKEIKSKDLQIKAETIRDEIVKEVDSHMNGAEQFDDITIAAAIL